MSAPTTPQQVASLAKRRECPRCNFDKTYGNALCRRCRNKLPANMRVELEKIPTREPGSVARAMRAAANYFNVHFQSIRNFGGGRPR
jgi:predicted amidophosphoribosyltransferase